MRDIDRRLRKLQRQRQPKMLEIPLYNCTVDGKAMQLDLLDAAFMEQFNGCAVTIGEQCGVRYQPAATEAQQLQARREVDEIMQNYCAQTPAEAAAEAAELERIVKLRHEDIVAGRDPDQCHPLPL